MSDISQIDKNFKIETKISKSDIKFYNVRQEPFKIYGIFHENGKFRRMPESVAKSVSDGVYWLHSNTAGGRVCFKTNSPYIAIHAQMANIGKMSHFALAGSCGFDLYVRDEKEQYVNTLVPPFDIIDGYEGVIELGTKKEREIVINFPLYSDVIELYVGISDASTLSASTPYKIEKPIVFYGSSITQGGCASRPGSSYQAILSRELSVNYINLGFSGNAMAEDEMASYISSLDMSAFVYDYDHNSPSVEHLMATHEKMFNAIRERHKELPIIIMSRPKYTLTPDEKKRLKIIRTTYKNALAKGDKNVYFINGKSLMRICKDNGTVDNCHPTDLGFFSMAKALLPILKAVLK
ncbi:MAG: SGNH/GDSL hydrolase family protein [Clostridia bacterium]|nr:SGNH/GDSL hydrolase family protein [Clostridia bacterium]